MSRIATLVATLSIAASLTACATDGKTPAPVAKPPKPAAPVRPYGAMKPIPNPEAQAPAPASPRPAPVPPVRRPSSTLPPAPAKPAAKPAAPAANAQRAAQLRAAGLEQLNRGAVDRAVALLRQAQQADPDNALIQRDLDRALRVSQAVRARP